MNDTTRYILEQVKVILAAIALVTVLAAFLYAAIFYIVGPILSKTPLGSTVYDIKTEKECEDKGHAWHAVDGCFTQDAFVERYVDN